VLADICAVLEIANSRDAAARLDNDEKNTVVLTDGIRGNPNFTIINEPGMYRLVMRSDKPAARRFQKWLSREVIPSIRKTGSYNLRAGGLNERLDACERRLTALESGSTKVKTPTARQIAVRSDIARFVQEELVLAPEGVVARKDLYEAYRAFGGRLSTAHFGRQLRAVVSNVGDCRMRIDSRGEQVRMYTGVALRSRETLQ